MLMDANAKKKNPGVKTHSRIQKEKKPSNPDVL